MTQAPVGDGAIVHRLLNFSDAVFAFALTLLVLELRPPEGMTDAALRSSLMTQLPQLGAFAGTFAVVSIFWIAHMSYMRRLTVFDWPCAVINLVVLFCVVLTPFASATLGQHGNHAFAWRVYGGTLIAISLAQTLLWLALSRGGGRLLGGVGGRERAYRALRALSPGMAFAAGLVAIELGRLELVIWSPLLIVPLMLLSGALFGPRPPRPA